MYNFSFRGWTATSNIENYSKFRQRKIQLSTYCLPYIRFPKTSDHYMFTLRMATEMLFETLDKVTHPRKEELCVELQSRKPKDEGGRLQCADHNTCVYDWRINGNAGLMRRFVTFSVHRVVSTCQRWRWGRDIINTRKILPGRLEGKIPPSGRSNYNINMNICTGYTILRMSLWVLIHLLCVVMKRLSPFKNFCWWESLNFT